MSRRLVPRRTFLVCDQRLESHTKVQSALPKKSWRGTNIAQLSFA